MMKLSRLVLVFLGLLLLLPSVNPGFLPRGELASAEAVDPPFLFSDSAWVDSIIANMDLDEKIGQLLMIQAYSNRGPSHLEELVKQVSRYGIGGVIFFQGSAEKQTSMINKLQAVSEIPLLIAMDAEWGPAMRLENLPSYPRQMQLGAIQNDTLIFEMGKDIAKQLKDLGVHMNFAPVADINNNPANPVINSRSFGEERENVSEKVKAYFLGMQSERLLVTAKHFPGHGDTNVDSHLGLPLIPFDRARLDSLELYPFKEAIVAGLTGIMVAHLQVPELDGREKRPTTLSEYVVRDLLHKELAFKGLTVTDALNMKGVSENFDPGEIELEAFKAGNDILLMPSDVPKVINTIKKAIRKGEISEERLDLSCRKILLAKKWAGLDTLKPLDARKIHSQITDRKYSALRDRLAEASLTLIRDRASDLPLQNLDKMQLATINIGVDAPSEFCRTLNLYHSGKHYFYPGPESFPDQETLQNELHKYNTLILSIYYTRSFGNNYDIPQGVKEFINALEFKGKLILNLFGYPYALNVLGDLKEYDAILISYANDEVNQHYAAQGIFGGTSITGKLPVSISAEFPVGTGILTKGGTRLSYGIPELVGMNFDTLKKIDYLVNEAIRSKAMPGCQVLVARKGQVVWNKSYGYHSFRKRQEVKNSDIYDLASITKIAATIPSLMRLQDQNRFSIDSTLGDYYPGIDTSKKASLKIRDVLTHQAGLKAWIPFYTNTLEPLDTSQELFSKNFSYTYPYRIGPAAYANRNIGYRDSIYNSHYEEKYPLQVAENLYLRSDYRDTIYDMILRSPLGESVYLYSDLGYYFLFRSVEEITDTLFYPYTWFNFYGPLGAETMGFLPLNRFPRDQIIPTENDLIFRKQLVHGYVHDPGAAMLGGICGHAGLFSNANDLAKMMQLYLNYGSYGGKQYIDSATIAEFTRCQYCENDNRRGLGFDRPIPEDDEGPACNSASGRSFGHSGFTGTIAWMDPEYDLLYIFLSNRIHPDQDNTKLISMDVRTNIQEVIYRAIESSQ